MTSLQHQQEKNPKLNRQSFCPYSSALLMAFGNVAMFLCARFVAKGTAPVVMDMIFFIVAIGLIVVRYVDITKFKGQTSEGKPATLAHWRQYAVLTAVISTGVWALARIAYFYNWF